MASPVLFGYGPTPKGERDASHDPPLALSPDSCPGPSEWRAAGGFQPASRSDFVRGGERSPCGARSLAGFFSIGVLCFVSCVWSLVLGSRPPGRTHPAWIAG